MRKTVTLTGKAAESYFNARCAAILFLYGSGMVGREDLSWQQSLKETNLCETRSFGPELYPVLIIEYRFKGKSPSLGGKTDMIVMDVIGDVM